MKVALVHDYLTEYGGAERVLEAIHEIWPDAPVYTSICANTSALLFERSEKYKVPERSEGFLHSAEVFDEKWDIRVSALQKFPFARWLLKQYTFFYPLVFEHFDLREYDLVISDGTIWSKGVLTTPEQLHIHYCHTPARFLYHYPAESSRRYVWYYRPVVRLLDHYLRVWDFESAQRPDFIVANSQTVAGRIRKFWRREAMVIYPPVEVGAPSSAAPSGPRELHSIDVPLADPSVANASSDDDLQVGEYYLVVSRLSAYKNVHLAIEACNKLKLPLVVVGTGREEERLKKLAGPTVKFYKHLKNSELSKVYKDCKVLIHPVSDEDFGIAPVEAMSFGKPVIALRSGGVTETVIEGKTGVFFEEPAVESLVEVLKNFDTAQYSSGDCIAQAQEFSKERFQKEFQKFVEDKLQEFKNSSKIKPS